MISYRVRSPLESEWTEIVFEGDEEAAVSHILAATLMRLDFEIWVSRDGAEWYELGEDEEPA